MNFSHATLYGILQGLTEFLPVSSSAHLALLPKFLDFKDPGVAFDLSMHVGTAIAVIVYFKSRIAYLFKEIHKTLLTRKVGAYLYNFTLATFVTILLALLTKDFASVWGRKPLIIAINLFFFGLLLYLSDFKKRSKFDPYKDKSLSFALIIGLFQAMAIFPGVSRSGATMTVARVKGASRELAGDFSFLLSLPIILGGFFYEVIEHGGNFDFEWTFMFYGIFISFMVGILTIHFFMKFIKNFGFLSFFIYKTFLSLLVIYYLL